MEEQTRDQAGGRDTVAPSQLADEHVGAAATPGPAPDREGGKLVALRCQRSEVDA